MATPGTMHMRTPTSLFERSAAFRTHICIETGKISQVSPFKLLHRIFAGFVFMPLFLADRTGGLLAKDTC
jgi:hypothetical protein